jgi:cytoskeletal protein RodZ
MYEDEVPVFRRILWFALWFIVIVAVLWFLVWLIFFRETTPKHNTSTNKSGSHSQSASNQPPQSNPGSQSNTSGNASNGSNKSGSSSATSTPDHLANTGAGDVFIPFGVATVAGTVIYYVRLRRKLLT